MTAFVTAGAGFLLAVLWFDLMHDVQARGTSGEVPEPALASIAGYYARVTTGARPMNRLVAAAMLATVAALVAQLAGDDVGDGVAGASLALAVAPISLAGARTVRNAVRLGRRADDLPTQSRLARAILRDHVLCFVSIGTLLAVQLAGAR